MYRTLAITSFLLLVGYSACAQGLDTVAYAKRYQKIEELHANGQIKETIGLYEIQIESLRKAGRFDSLYLFAYYYPIAIAQIINSQAGIDMAESVVTEVENKDQNIRHHLIALNDLSWVYYELGRPEAALQVDLRYLDKVNEYNKSEPRDKYVANYNVAADYQNLGNAKTSISYFKKAIEAVLFDTVNYQKDLINCFNGLGAAQYRNGEFSKAKESLIRGIELNATLGDTAERYLNDANINGNLALVFEEEGNLVMSKQYLERSLESRKKGLTYKLPSYSRTEHQNHLIKNYHNLSGLYLRIGDVNRSLKVQEQVKTMREELLDKDHVDHLKSLDGFGNIQMALGNYDQALSIFTQYLEFCQTNFGSESFYTCIAHIRLGELAINLENWPIAIQHFSEAIRVAKQITGEFTGQELARAYLARATCHNELKDFAKAETDIRQYILISQTTRESSDPFFARGYNCLSEIKLRAGQLDSAKYYCDKAIALVVEHRNKQKSSGRRYDHFTFTLPESYLLQAEIILAENHDEKQLRDASIALSMAIDGIQEQKRMLESGSSQVVLIDRLIEVFNLAQTVYFELWQTSKDDNYLDEMLKIAELSKSTLLRGHLNRFTSLRVASMPDSIAVKENQLLMEMSGQKIDSNKAERDDYVIEAEFDALLKEMAEKYPDYYRLRYQEFVANSDTITKVLLKPGLNILEYSLIGDRSFGFLINQNGLIVKELDTRLIESTIASYRHAMQNRDIAKTAKLGHELYLKLFKPFETDFDQTELLIIPQGELFKINFEALTRNSDIKKLDYLIETYTISYILSATTALQYSTLKHKKAKGLLALAPGFSDELKQLYTQLTSAVDYDEKYANFIQQPFAVKSVKGLDSYFDSKLLIGKEANEDNFKQDVEQYGIIHLGTHTEINNLSPLLSRLVLAKSGDDEDGYLHAYEIYNLSLRAELAVLTACETGSGKSSSSEGMLSLAHSFAYAGCPSILMSLWQIDEQSAAIIIDSFYKYLAKGKPKNQALRLAKLDYLQSKSNELSHPYYWSGMVLLGEVSPVSSSHSNIWIIFTLIALIVLGTIVLFRRRKRAKMRRSMN